MTTRPPAPFGNYLSTPAERLTPESDNLLEDEESGDGIKSLQAAFNNIDYLDNPLGQPDNSAQR